MSDPAAIALALSEVDQGIACAGTALESRTFLVNGKVFLFLSNKHLRLKLGRSIADAKVRGFDVGAAGWVKLDMEDLPAQSILKAWISESYSQCAGAGGVNAKPARSKSRRNPVR